MSLRIKGEEAHQLARELAQRTGESITVAVTNAIRERLERTVRRESLAERLCRIGQDCAAHLDEHTRLLEPGDLLYDERGLVQ